MSWGFNGSQISLWIKSSMSLDLVVELLGNLIVCCLPCIYESHDESFLSLNCSIPIPTI